MARRESRMLELGTTAADFALTDVVTGHIVQRQDFVGSPLLVAFICNHCPYVKHILDSFLLFSRAYLPQGLAIVV